MSTVDLDGAVAVVTGASRGIGRALCVGLAGAGARVCCAARTEASAGQTVAAIESTGGRAMAAVCDVTDPGSVEATFEAAGRRFGGVDVAVVNAGIGPDSATVEDSQIDEWRSVVETNLIGSYHTVRAAVPHLRRSKAGKIIVIGSGAGHRGLPGSSAYSTSKAALWMLVKVAAAELGPLGISVNELIPGPVDTDMLRATTSAEHASALRQVEWFKDPEDVVPLALFLAAQPSPGPTAQSFSLMRREC